MMTIIRICWLRLLLRRPKSIRMGLGYALRQLTVGPHVPLRIYQSQHHQLRFGTWASRSLSNRFPWALGGKHI